MKKLLIGSALTLFLSGVANADGSYINLGVSALDDGDIRLGAVTGRYGYNFGEHWGVEAEASFGVIDHTENVLGTDVNVEVDYSVGAFLFAKTRISENLEVLGRVGYSTISVTAKSDGLSESASDDGIALGAAGTWYFADHHGVRLDYTRIRGSDVDYNNIGLAYVLNF